MAPKKLSKSFFRDSSSESESGDSDSDDSPFAVCKKNVRNVAPKHKNPTGRGQGITSAPTTALQRLEQPTRAVRSPAPPKTVAVVAESSTGAPPLRPTIRTGQADAMLKARAFWAVSEDDDQALVSILNGVARDVWSTWSNQLGQTLLQLAIDKSHDKVGALLQMRLEVDKDIACCDERTTLTQENPSHWPLLDFEKCLQEAEERAEARIVRAEADTEALVSAARKKAAAAEERARGLEERLEITEEMVVAARKSAEEAQAEAMKTRNAAAEAIDVKELKLQLAHAEARAATAEGRMREAEQHAALAVQEMSDAAENARFHLHAHEEMEEECQARLQRAEKKIEAAYREASDATDRADAAEAKLVEHSKLIYQADGDGSEYVGGSPRASLAISNLFSEKVPAGVPHVEIGNTSHPSGTGKFSWTFYIRGSTKYLDEAIVTLHPTFEVPVRSLRNPSFQISSQGWATFSIGVLLIWVGGVKSSAGWELQFVASDMSKRVRIPEEVLG
eukprot:TRINITY_DN12067_c0_g1_i1.p1 TRINITY_DN12067_c0_g1~~TRINITY_DN12067_c0_g1_i1.p1  ORF type:complete len:506 (+),score=108.94 TRINITY_DN12067_c0_g1_i1:337-1854(+)